MRCRIRSALVAITAAMLLGSGAALAESNACKADISEDGVVNFVDLAVLKSAFFQSCPTPPRFEDRGLTVFDHQTGLEWEKKTNDPDTDNDYTWSTGTPWNPNGAAFTVFLAFLNDGGECVTESAAGTAVTSWGYAGHCDWRLPTISELKTIVDCSHGAPCVAPILGPTQSTNYWSSSSDANVPYGAWYVYLVYGLSGNDFKTNFLYVRAVRGGL